MQIRDRVKELRRVKAGLLRPNPEKLAHPSPGATRRLAGRAGGNRLRRRAAGPRIARRHAGTARRPPPRRDDARNGGARAGRRPRRRARRPSCWPSTIRLTGMAEANQQVLAELLAEVETDSDAVQGLLGQDVGRGGAARGDVRPARPRRPRWTCPNASRSSSSVPTRTSSRRSTSRLSGEGLQVPAADAVRSEGISSG